MKSPMQHGFWTRVSFIWPALIFLLVMTIFPFLFTLALAFGKVSLIGGLSIEIGTLANWRELLTDERFWNATRVTVVFVAAGVAVQYVIGLCLALLLNRNVRGNAFFRVLFIVPMTLTPIAVGYMWRQLFNQTFGPINDLLSYVGLGTIPWLSEGTWALTSIIIVDIWHWTPFVFILLLAGLQSLPQEVIESARVDGANAWQTFRHIIFPLLLPISIATVLLRSLEASKIVDEIFVMTGGGPGVSTESLTLYAYNSGLQSFDLSYGATIAVGLFAGVLLSTVLYLLATTRLSESRLW